MCDFLFNWMYEFSYSNFFSSILNFQVIRVDPDTGKLLYTLPIPSWEVTSVVFGGPNLDELYVTSANQFKNNPKDKYPQPGQTFKVTNLGVKGTPSVSIKLN